MLTNYMVHAWNKGMSLVRNPKSQVEFKGLSEAIVQAGYSVPVQPINDREVIGRSELLGGNRI